MSEDTQKPETVIESIIKGNAFGQNLLGKANAAVSNAEIQRMVMGRPPRLPSPGEQIFDALEQQIRLFQGELSEGEEVALMQVSGPMGLLHVDLIELASSNLIIFRGTLENGHKCMLVQHALQVNLQLVAVPTKCETPRKIGFVVADDLTNGVPEESPSE